MRGANIERKEDRRLACHRWVSRLDQVYVDRRAINPRSCSSNRKHHLAVSGTGYGRQWPEIRCYSHHALVLTYPRVTTIKDAKLICSIHLLDSEVIERFRVRATMTCLRTIIKSRLSWLIKWSTVRLRRTSWMHRVYLRSIWPPDLLRAKPRPFFFTVLYCLDFDQLRVPLKRRRCCFLGGGSCARTISTC